MTTIPAIQNTQVMLRITHNKSAQGAAKYFDEGLARADYYATGEHSIGRWGGLSAERLGLQGEVAKQDFVALCQNQMPDGRKLNPRDGAERKVGYDFTFSAPKSVSIAYAITGDERVRDAFERSVTETMQEMEQEMRTQSGQGKDKKHMPTGNMVWAEFTHLTSRPVGGVPDCHLHTHCFALNTTWNESKQRFQAGEFGNIKKAAPYYEAAFDARFAKRMKQLGYGIEKRGHSWELAGIGQDTIRKFSRRTSEIETVAKKEAEANGFLTAKQKDKLGGRTRAQKRVGQSYEELRIGWAARLSDEETDCIITAHRKGEQMQPGAMVREALGSAVRHSFERKSVMEENQLLTETLKRGYGEVLPEEAKVALHDGRFFRRRLGNHTYITTQEALDEEHSMVRHVREGRGTLAPINPGYVPKGEHLNEEQKAATRHALSSTDQVTVISGGAGTGKTTLMKEVRDGIHAGGKQIFGFAPYAAASRGVMREEGFGQADTLAQLLINSKLQEQVKHQVIWVDEAGLIGNKDMNRLLEIAKKQEARILLTGDIRQHSAVSAGDALRIIEERGGIEVARVDAVQRQRKNEQYKQVVEMIAAERIEEAVGKLDRMGGVVEVADQQKRLDALAKDYLEAIEKRKTALVVSPVHREAGQVTEAIREQLKAGGHLQKEERQIPVYRSLNLTEEDRANLALAVENPQGLMIEFHQNAKGFVKGERVEVAASDLPQMHHLAVTRQDGSQTTLPLVHAKKFTVYRKDILPVAVGDKIRITKGGQTQEGSRVHNGDFFTVQGFDRTGNIQIGTGKTLASDFAHLSHGYVTTSHSSQGKTVDRVFIAQSEISDPAASRQQFYVSLSRGREMAKVYTDDKAALEKSIMRDGKRMTASEIADMQKTITVQKEYSRAVKSRQRAKNRETYVQREEPGHS